MNNSSESSQTSGNAKRFDDLVRSARYFTATLLPAVLFNGNLRGVRESAELIDAKAKTGVTDLANLDQNYTKLSFPGRGDHH